MPKMTKVPKMPKIEDVNHFIKKEAVQIVGYSSS
jgi:hypothetical protein